MKVRLTLLLFAVLCWTQPGIGQVTNSLPGRSVVKLAPDYLRPRVYALNKGNGTTNGTLLALNATNGATLNEITISTNPTHMVLTAPGDALYIIHAGSRTISKVDLTTFAVVGEKPITTPNTYSLANPLYLVAGQSGNIFYTDGAWGPEIYAFDFNAGTNRLVLDTGGNQSSGAGGMVLNRNGDTLYIWQQYGWSAGSSISTIASLAVATNNSLTTIATGPSQGRDPLDTPIFLDAAERWVFNKVQMVSATNVAVLLTSFAENLYGISFDGSLAFGPTKVFNTQTGVAITNLPFSTTVQTLSGDQKKLFRYKADTSSLIVYDMAGIAPTTGPTVVPTPADGAIVSLPPTNLVWSVSPIALSYDVYFGTNQAQVTAATPASSQYLGRVTSPATPVPGTLSAGKTYYWRVDVAGFSTTNAGPTWSFTVSPLAILPDQIAVGAIAGYNPASITLSLTSAVSISWTATVAGASWLKVSPTNGASPSAVTVSFNTAALAVGIYTNRIDIKAGGLTVPIPVTLDIKALNVRKMAADSQRPYIYALQAPVSSGQNGQLLFINTATSNIDKTLPIGINPVDMAIHYGEGRLYIASWTENATYVVDLVSQTLLPPLHLGTDVYKINAGKPGRVIIEGQNQWVYMSVINTTNGASLTSGLVREGDGELAPSGAAYYHCDNNISDAHITKYLLTNDSPAAVAGSLQHPYGSRNLVMAPDGTRLFWQGYVYDASLNEMGNLGEQIYATTLHGDLALGNLHVFNTRNGQNIYTLPFSTTNVAVSGDQQKVFLFNSSTKQLVVIPMDQIAGVPGPGLIPTPADGDVVNLPLSQVSWSASPFALTYRVFLGTDQAAVAAATTNSPLFLGEVSNTAFALTNVLAQNATYYWRVDSVGFSSVTAGSVWSFTAAAVSVTPQSLSVKGVYGLALPPLNIQISSTTPTSWTLSASQGWLSASDYSGTTPSTVTLYFDTTGFAAGFYTNQLTISANGTTLQLPVIVQLFNLAASKMVADRNRDYIYVLHPGSGSFDDAYLLFLNTVSGVVEQVIPIGSNPTDLTVNSFEDRLYVSNWLHNKTHVVDLVTRTELAPLTLGTDVYKINAGPSARIVTEEEDQWIYASLVNTVGGTNITSAFLREGDGEFDPTGRYYYHGDNNISGAGMTKYDVSNDTFASVASAGGHYYYGSRNIVMSFDGSRVFWTGAAYTANLTDLGSLGAEIYGCTVEGALAFSDHQAIDTASKQVVFNLPTTTTVMAVDRLDQQLWYFNSSTHLIESVALQNNNNPPAITQQPYSSTVIIGGNVTLRVIPRGPAPFSYKWFLAGTELPGQTDSSLTLTNIQPSQAGDYQATVDNSFGSVTSAVAHVTVVIPPGIATQPRNTNVLAGRTFSLSVVATGSTPLAYQWTFEGSTIAGATNSALTITNAQPANEGIYRVVVTNLVGSVTSSAAIVRVLPAAPTIVSGPASLTVPASSNASFAVSATGSTPLFYQWLFNGSPVTGATAAQYTLTNAQSLNAGSYRVAVTNVVGAVTSAVATLSVSPLAPYFVAQPSGASLPAATNLTLAVLARGSEPISYQWRKGGAAMSGATQSSLLLSNLTVNASGAYDVIANNGAGSATSLVASVVVTASPPVFVQQPASTTNLAGTTITLDSLASGNAPIRYQWYFKNGSLLNQTNSQLTLSAVTTNATGPYFAVATNAYGRATSSVAQVTVNQQPFLQQGLADLIADAGSTVVLGVAAGGSGVLGYSWQLNGAPVAGTNASLTLSNAQPAQSGYYAVTISSQYGSISSTGRLTVFGPPSRLIAWGDNSGGQNNVPAGLNDAVAVAGGDFHTLALRRDGSLRAWGYNGDGQTSLPTNATRYLALAAGAGHSLAVMENGNVAAWGRNDAGQATVPATAVSVLTVAAGDSHSVALLSSGTLLAWGDDSFGQVSGAFSLTGVRAIAAGRNHNLALRSDGTVAGWGFNSSGQASPPAGLSAVAKIAAGYVHSLALRSNGTVVVWGDNSYGQTNAPLGLSNVVAIAAGDFHSLALRANGSVIVWGDNSYNQLNVPASVSNAVGIASGYYHALAQLPTPILRFSPNPAGLLLWWDPPAVLQSAPTPAGPYTDLPGPSSSYTNSGRSTKFFRLRR